MRLGELFLGIILIAPSVYGIYLIAKGIVYYKFAEEREATVTYVSDLKKGARNGGVYYSVSVDVEDDGEIFNMPLEGMFSVKRMDYALQKGDKVTVWYIKKYQRCISARNELIWEGLVYIIIAAVIAAICAFSLFCVKH